MGKLERRWERYAVRELVGAFDLPESEFLQNYKVSKEMVQYLCEELHQDLSPKTSQGLPVVVKISYISTEHPAIYWYDTKYFKNFTLLNRRWIRQDPRYYVELYVHLLFTAGNNVKLDFYFYQFLTNRYKPSFVEMHFKLCDMINSDPFFGQALRIAAGNQSCPFPPGAYDWNNMSIPYVPKGFPFPKGRIYCNISVTEDGLPKYIVRASMDMEVKVGKIKKDKIN